MTRKPMIQSRTTPEAWNYVSRHHASILLGDHRSWFVCACGEIGKSYRTPEDASAAWSRHVAETEGKNE